MQGIEKQEKCCFGYKKELLETSRDPPALQGQKSQLPMAARSFLLVSGPSPASLRDSGVAQASLQSEPLGQFEPSLAV